jgi:hypothetical protein
MLEHVEDWRTAVKNLKAVCKPGGLLIITTRSQGFHVHDYPGDFWRFQLGDMEVIFGDCEIVVLERDVETHPGVMMKAVGSSQSAVSSRQSAGGKRRKVELEKVQLYSVRDYMYQKNRGFYQFVYDQLSKLSEVSGSSKGLIGAEIGAGEGTNLWWATMLIPLQEFHIIDNFKPYKCQGEKIDLFVQYQERIKGLFARNANVKVHIMDSIEAADQFKNEYFDFVYLDGNWDEIEQDLAAWFIKVKTGGIIGGGGANRAGVIETVQRILGEVTVERNEWWKVV